ncbi:inositol monophosphatase family protein, partial [Pseudomonas aeruginosa]|uniref:inositol monophosphatase family protein n=1 Tax=Pseudomonas aeruginosa TaxID=287 RepID=UPI003CC5B2D4
MQPMLNIALRAARSAGELIFRSIERLDVISVNEKDAKDYVTEVDRAAEQTIVAALRKAYPTHAIMGEEGGFIEGSGEGADYLWVIDPLDGTTNFIHGVPHFAVSIACKYKGRLEHAVVLDPVRQEEFTASRGRGGGPHPPPPPGPPPPTHPTPPPPPPRTPPPVYHPDMGARPPQQRATTPG